MNPYELIPWLLLILAVLLGILWFKPVPETVIYVTYWLGEFHRVLWPGPHAVYRPFETYERISTADRQFELPHERERIDRVSQVPPPGMFKPFRINHNPYNEAIWWVKKGWKDGDKKDYPFKFDAESLDELEPVPFSEFPPELQETLSKGVYHAPLLGEWGAVIEWKVKADLENSTEEKVIREIRNYIRNVSTAEGRTRDEEVRKRATDLAQNIMDSYLAHVTYGHAKDMLGVFGRHFFRELEYLVGEKIRPGKTEIDSPWGIHITKGFLKEPYAGETVARALAEAASAASRSQDIIRTSEAEAQETKNKADADKYSRERAAEAREFELEKEGIGEGKRLAEMAKQITSPEAKFAAALEVLEEVLPKANATYLQTGPAGLLGLVQEIANTAAASGQKQPENRPNA